MKKINKIIIPFIGISFISIPAVLAISCGGETSQDPQKPTASTDEDLTIDAIEKENELKLQKANEINLLIDEVVLKASAPVLSNIGKHLTATEIANDFSSANFIDMNAVEIMNGDEKFSSIEIKPISAEVIDVSTGRINVKIQVSSKVEMTKVSTYDVEVTTPSLTADSQSTSLKLQAISEAKNSLLEASHGLFETNTPYAPELNGGQAFSTITLFDLSRSGSDFVIKTNGSGIKFQVNGVDLNPGNAGKISLNIYYWSDLLFEEYEKDNVTSWEGTFKVELDKTLFKVDSTNHRGNNFRPLNFTELPNNGIHWREGIATMANGMSLSMVMDFAERIQDPNNGNRGWERQLNGETKNGNVEHDKIIDQINAVGQMPATIDDEFLQKYFTASWNLGPQAQETLREEFIQYSHVYNNDKFVGFNPLLSPAADGSRNKGSAKPKIAAASGGINLAQGFSDVYSTYNAAVDSGSFVTDHAIQQNAQLSTYISSKRPGVVFSDLTFGTEIEHIYESPTGYVRTYDVVPLRDKERYVLTLNSMVDGIHKLIQNEGDLLESASSFIDADLADAILYIDNHKDLLTRERISEIFDDMNNGTYYWPAIEVFETGITGVPREYYDKTGLGPTRTIPGFQSITSFAGLAPWFKLSAWDSEHSIRYDYIEDVEESVE